MWNSPSFRSQLFNNQKTNPSLPSFYTERDDNGHYYISGNLVSYSNIRTGVVLRIRKSWTPKDWECYQALASKGQETGQFRIDQPLYSEVMTIGSDQWEYAELQSPGANYGKNFNDDVFSWPELTDGVTANTKISEDFKDSVKDYFKEFIDQAYVITKAASEIAAEKNTGMPLDLCYIFNRYKDDQGYFWSDFDQAPWDNSKDAVIEDSLNKLTSAVMFASLCGVLDSARIEEVILYARSKWTTI